MTTMADVRKFMEAAVGKITPARAQELARSVTQGAGKDQVAKAAQEILDWSSKNRQRMSDLVRSEVRSQLSSMGVATKDEVDALKKRVRELERGRPKRTTAKKRTAAKRVASTKTGPRPAEMPTSTTPATPRPTGGEA